MLPESSAEEPVHLPPEILRHAPVAPPPPRAPVRWVSPAALTVGRRTDNELILFHEAAAESWIVYPPRSAYTFLGTRRPSASVTVVEHHPWSAVVPATDHLVDPRGGCQAHGLDCGAQAAITAAVQLGYDPFA